MLGLQMFFVVVYGPGRVHQRLQCGTVGLGRSRYALGSWLHFQVFEMSARCALQAVFHRTSYRLGCASAWLPDMFVVVYSPGRVHQRLQRGVIGLGWCHYASLMADDDHAVVDMAARSQASGIADTAALAAYAWGFDIIFHNLPFLVQFFNARFFF